MDQLSPPEVLNLDGNVAENWRRWKQRFEIFSLASGLSEKDAGVQAATFLHVAGPEALEVYNTFSWAAKGLRFSASLPSIIKARPAWNSW